VQVWMDICLVRLPTRTDVSVRVLENGQRQRQGQGQRDTEMEHAERQLNKKAERKTVTETKRQ